MTEKQSIGNNIVFLQHIPGRGMVPSTRIELPETSPPALRINIIFTDIGATEIAVKRATELSRDLKAQIQMIVPHVVPYPLPLENPAVPLEFTRHRLRVLAGHIGAALDVYVFLCRDVIELLLKLLPVDSIVILGDSKRWLFPTRAERIARRLRKNGCHVILARY